MSTVTQQMILEYIRKKGGRVKNVDLVKHFRKHLLYEDKQKKEQARELFKETVNSVAIIRQEEGEKFLYLKDDQSPKSQSEQIPPIRTPLQSVQQSPNKISQPHPLSPTRSSIPMNPLLANSQQRTSQSNNLGRPTDLSNGLPPSGITHPKPYQYQNGISDLQQTEEKSLSPKRKTPVPYPKPSERSNPQYHQSGTNSTGVSSYQGNGVPEVTRIPETQIKNSPRVLSPPRSHTSSPRVMSPPRTVNRRTDGDSSSQSNHVRQHRPVSSTNSQPFSQSPVHNRSSQPHHSSRLVAQATAPTLTPPQSTLSGRGNSKRGKLEISGPVNVLSLNNGPTMLNSAHPIFPSITASSLPNSVDDKLLFERYTSELENIGVSSSFLNTPNSFEISSLGSIGDFLPKDVVPGSHRPVSSENSSLSSTSVQSTSSPPPVDLHSGSNPNVKLAHMASQKGIVGVQKLIQQYTVPPGAVVTSPPTDVSLLLPTKSAKVGRSASSVSNNSSDVVLRRQLTPPDSKVQRSHSNVGNIANRRSRLLERNSTLDTLTRQSIKGVHKRHHRQSRNSDELITSSKEDVLTASSREELLSYEDQDRDSPTNERYDDYSFDIEPLEKEWMLAIVDNNMDDIHRILMTDNTFINKKGFLHGWTALHWAVKESNEELIRSLIVSGAKVDIRSGLTPLHVAAESGTENIIRLLVYEYDASTNIRDHSGRRPIDMLHMYAPESMRTTLRNGLKSIPGFRNASLAIAMGVSVPNGNSIFGQRGTMSGTLARNWNSTGHLIDAQATDKMTNRRSQMSPRVARKGFSFRRKKYQVNARDKRDSSSSEYYHERKES